MDGLIGDFYSKNLIILELDIGKKEKIQTEKRQIRKFSQMNQNKFSKKK